MKQTILLVLALFFFQFLSAQDDCVGGYLPFTEGLEVEQTHYTARGKVGSVHSYKVISVQEENGVYTARSLTSVSDGKKNSKSTEMEGTIICKNGGWEFDFKESALSMIEEMPENVDIQVESSPVFFPASMKPGDELPDAEIRMSASMMGMKLMDVTVKQVNRKVVQEEKITVPAGTFDCIKVTYDLDTELGGRVRKTAVVNWMAKGVGLIKEESYKDGKLESYIEATAVKR